MAEQSVSRFLKLGTLTFSILLRASGWERGRGEVSRSVVSYSQRHGLAFFPNKFLRYTQLDQSLSKLDIFSTYQSR